MAVPTDNHAAQPLHPSFFRLKNQTGIFNRIIFYTFLVVRAICFRLIFSGRKVQFCGQTTSPLPHAPIPCHTIKNHGWEKMDCSLPSHSVVLLLDGITGPRWQAGRREVSSSSIWPSGRWSGPWVPSLGSLQMCLVLLLFMSCIFSLQRIFTQSHFGPQELAGSCLRRGAYVLLSGVIFYTNMCGSKGVYEYSIRAISLETWGAWLGGGGCRNKSYCVLTPSSLSTPTVSFLLKSNFN